MIASPEGERQRRQDRVPHRSALLPLVLIVHGLFGYWVISMLLSTGTSSLPAALKSVPHARSVDDRTRTTASPAAFAEITGLEVLRVAVSGAGGILDLRYRVVDEKTASAHAGHQAVPAIIDARTGTALTRQWMGHAHAPDSFRASRLYWMLFLNPGELVKRGDRVTVRLGHARLTGVRVR